MTARYGVFNELTFEACCKTTIDRAMRRPAVAALAGEVYRMHSPRAAHGAKKEQPVISSSQLDDDL